MLKHFIQQRTYTFQPSKNIGTKSLGYIFSDLFLFNPIIDLPQVYFRLDTHQQARTQAPAKSK